MPYYIDKWQDSYGYWDIANGSLQLIDEFDQFTDADREALEDMTDTERRNYADDYGRSFTNGTPLSTTAWLEQQKKGAQI